MAVVAADDLKPDAVRLQPGDDIGGTCLDAIFKQHIADKRQPRLVRSLDRPRSGQRADGDGNRPRPLAAPLLQLGEFGQPARCIERLRLALKQRVAALLEHLEDGPVS